jgi:hypothetical protein
MLPPSRAAAARGSSSTLSSARLLRAGALVANEACLIRLQNQSRSPFRPRRCGPLSPTHSTIRAGAIRSSLSRERGSVAGPSPTSWFCCDLRWKLTLEQPGLQPPSRLVLREEDEVSVFDVEYRLEPIETGTRFTQISEFEWKKLPRVLRGTFARGVRRDVRTQLRALRQHLEH